LEKIEKIKGGGEKIGRREEMKAVGCCLWLCPGKKP
jgi:hypothetical protein